MSQIQVAKVDYSVGQLNALQQFHVTRRLGPMLIVAGIGVEMLKGVIAADSPDLLEIAPQVMTMLQKMSDEDSNYVIFTCLSAVKRKQGDAWAPCISPDGRTIMFEDIKLPHMIRLVIEVLKENLANFLTELDGVRPTQSS